MDLGTRAPHVCAADVVCGALASGYPQLWRPALGALHRYGDHMGTWVGHLLWSWKEMGFDMPLPDTRSLVCGKMLAS